MQNLRKYGRPPYSVALLHGGPGAAGEMASLARLLAPDWGVLEPLQTALSVEGQVSELERLLTSSADDPLIIVGYSWGAWLGLILAAKRPELVTKLILVGSGAFEDSYVPQLRERRMSRLTPEEQRELEALSKLLEDPEVADKDTIFKKWGSIFLKTDCFDPYDDEAGAEDAIVNFNIYNNVWPKAAAMRSSGELLSLAQNVRCSVVAIHGDHDPTPAGGVENPLAERLERFKFFLVEKCGHTPWLEKQARATFIELLSNELKAGRRT